MSIVRQSTPAQGAASGANGSGVARPLHRLGVVRRLQGMSRRAVARRLNVDVLKIRAQERSTSDLSLSELYRWRDALEVPVSELLVEAGDELATPVLKRAQLVRLMKTVLAIREASGEEPIRRMAQTLIDQFLAIMPELEGVAPWHTVGRRRRRDELGVAAQRRLGEDVFIDLMD